jgi:hypothetical protein
MSQNVLAFFIDNGPSKRKIPFVKSKKWRQGEAQHGIAI